MDTGITVKLNSPKVNNSITMLNKYPINRLILIYTPRPLYFHLNKTTQISRNLFYYKMTKLKTKSNIKIKKKIVYHGTVVNNNWGIANMEIKLCLGHESNQLVGR